MIRQGRSEPNPGLERVRHQLRCTAAKTESREELRTGIHTRGYLPHVKREGATYFVTFRLADSLPREVLLRFEQERAEALRRLASSHRNPSLYADQINRKFRRKIERYLDRGAGECCLGRPDIAELVARALQHFHEERYLLDEWVVMPNHCHVIVLPLLNHLLGDILRSWKGFTGREANKILHRVGQPFWQPESYDHWIRDDRELARIQRYIRNNPVTGGLCSTPEAWRWSSAWPGWKDES